MVKVEVEVEVEVKVKVEVEVVLRPDPDSIRDYRDRSATEVEVKVINRLLLASLACPPLAGYIRPLLCFATAGRPRPCFRGMDKRFEDSMNRITWVINQESKLFF
jgi:hypothetical protein